MRILLISDLHLREDSPIGRIDNFQETMFRKFRFVLNTAKENDVDFILQAGDFLNKPNPSYKFVNTIIDIINEYDVPIFYILGQHDIYMRSKDINYSAIGTIEKALSALPMKRIVNKVSYNDLEIIGCSFSDSIPKNSKSNKIKILVIHGMIGNKPLFPGHDYVDASYFLRQNDCYSIILCGDYHYPFKVNFKGRTIINTGCMLRMTRDERDMNRNPCVYILDTNKNIQKINIPCEPASVVFSEINEVKQQSKIIGEGDLLRFIEKLKNKNKTGISYLEVLREYFNNNNISEEIKNIIIEAIGD